MRPFTVIIPLIPQHDSLLKVIFQDLMEEDSLVHEIIIARSESFLPSPILEARFKRWAKNSQLDCKISVDSILSKAADGQNRTRAWENAETKYVAFMDADDRYSSNRLSVIQNILEARKCDAVVHNYFSTEAQNTMFDRLTEPEQLVQLKPNTPADSEFGTVTDMLGKAIPLHYAHITVLNSLKSEVNYSERFPGADIEFCQNIIRSGKKVYYSPMKLSRWSRNRSIRYKARLLRKKMFSF